MVHVAAEDGSFIDQKHAYIAELVQEYQHNLRLAWIPEGRREPGDKPFAVIAIDRDGQDYIVLFADECDERIIERLYMSDNNKHDVQARTEAANRVAREMRRKAQEDEAEMRREFMRSVLTSPKSVYRHNGVKYT